MRFPRMTTRRWLVVVAVAGILLAIALPMGRSRRSSFLVQAKIFRQKADAARREILNRQVELMFPPDPLPPFRPRPDGERKFIVDGDKMYFEYVVTPGWRERKEAAERAAAKARQDEIARPQSALRKANAAVPYYDAMSRKYERAARYPWLPVATDPPEPK